MKSTNLNLTNDFEEKTQFNNPDTVKILSWIVRKEKNNGVRIKLN